MFNERLKIELNTQISSYLYRSPIIVTSKKKEKITTLGGSYINFSSNDYLGLGQNRYLNKQLQTAVKKYGTASSSSRLITGNNSTLEEAEKNYGNYFGYENSIFFPSGYQANIALLSTLFSNRDRILYDKKVHSSIANGLLLTKAKYNGYKHNSINHLKKRLAQNNSNNTVITESLFSMDGDILPIKCFKDLKKEFNFNLIVDEAHSFGVLGKDGKGISTGIADLAIGTLGKAFGFNGAFLLLPNRIKEYFLNFSTPLIYTTALPPYFGPYVIKLLNKISQMHNERDYVREISKYTKEQFINNGFQISGDAHILSVFIGEEKEAIQISKELRHKGILLSCCRYPTVGLGKAILRIGINTNIKQKHIDNLIRKIKECKI